jgi:hypothetical protein
MSVSYGGYLLVLEGSQTRRFVFIPVVVTEHLTAVFELVWY